MNEEDAARVVLGELDDARERIFATLKLPAPPPPEFIELYVSTLISEAMSISMGRGLDPQLPSADPSTVEDALKLVRAKLEFLAHAIDPTSSYRITVERNTL